MRKEHEEHEKDLVRFQAYFAEETLEKLRVLAFQRSTVHDRVTINDLIREAVRSWLKKQTIEPELEKWEERKGKGKK
ncbi:MAG: hypothetical protein ACYSTI_12880 [Planctomycetota bacterium]|jgi:hypothetical protein